MNLSYGRPYLAIPGPSVMPDEVLRAMHRASPNIYEGALIDMVAGMMPDLKRVAGTVHDAAIYISNGHGAWEAALSNVLAPGDRILVPATGRFGHGWAEMADGLGADTQLIDFGRNRPFDLNRIEEALRADKDHRIKAVLASHVDTSSGVRNDIAGLRKLLDQIGHPALLMADCIASLACDRFEMDAWGVDVTVAASQKGLMTPPGLGFVFFGPRAAEARAGLDRVSRYWDWTPRANPEMFYQYFGGTAPTHHLFGLRAALDMIHAEGIDHVWRRHDVLARAIWAAADTWASDGPLRLNVADPDHRARSVTSLRLGLPYGAQLRDWVETNAGVTLGIGLGMSEDGDPQGRGFFRIGHMGHLNAHMVLGMLGSIDTAFKALNVPHGRGALDAAATVMAQD
ncbi:alanine-glyoxylate transaminase / serine-glyoxylate transaminase / serine-pyruvate transaminase [Thalassovita gelatinovora]|uniref:pyridoxal-phosphate-dependent aminotransferase family protein n=1 Tax=Thalassovita gelatinovora TaxID=53501 RepID=UPI00071D9242|nr:aminotransferase class V-fold PLP-dependent enzyme [Thalassovita gelatinovora]QIZ82229.1 alanine--glyoxylate aminotransferase family protein [Thalassovita gelatinovora]SEQ98301.1 alanine-glyoxylate transaminase / serine-glyoxylate transaminase / serine-pyruvate transaminase [Thalassovita gelatinovora]